MSDPKPAAGRRAVSPLQIAMILAAVVVVAVAAVVVLGLGDDESADQAPGARAVSVEELQEVAGNRDRPIFWAGTLAGSKYEFTETRNGAAYVRYLTGDAEIGDPNPSYLTVATYPLDNGYARIVAASKREGSESEELQNGGLAVVNSDRPSSVYLAYPRESYQVEVYHPSPARARDLGFSGAIQPVR